MTEPFEKIEELPAKATSELKGSVRPDEIECPRCHKFVSGPKSEHGCLYCGHVNGLTAEARYLHALRYIVHRTDFWAIQDDEDIKPALEDCMRVVQETLGAA